MVEATVMQHTCDGCGATVAPRHVRERIARLEMATRFRPLHMQTLLLADAPPTALADFFYSSEGPRAGTGREERLFRSVMAAAGITASDKTTEACLVEFQRHGLYLAYALECPATAGVVSPELAGTLGRRIRFSYKPKNVVALDAATQGLIKTLSTDSLGVERLADCAGKAHMPAGERADEWALFENALREQLKMCAV